MKGGAAVSPLPILLTLVLTGCSALTPRDTHCRVNEAPSLPYSSMSRTMRTDNLPDGTLVSAHRYQLRPQQFQVMPCDNLLIVKELHARTAPGRHFRLSEVREFYADDGSLIAQAKEDVSRQIRRSGTYRGVLALPIPADTPAGIYRMVGKLFVDNLGETPILLNETETEFEVLPPPTPAAGSGEPRQTRPISKNRVPPKTPS